MHSEGRMKYSLRVTFVDCPSLPIWDQFASKSIVGMPPFMSNNVISSHPATVDDCLMTVLMDFVGWLQKVFGVCRYIHRI